MIALMMEAARTSETLVNFYQTTRRYNPEGSHLQKILVLHGLLAAGYDVLGYSQSSPYEDFFEISLIRTLIMKRILSAWLVIRTRTRVSEIFRTKWNALPKTQTKGRKHSPVSQ
jgi:hypothetical protein